MPSTWKLISTATVTAATQSSIVFTSISNDYSDLMAIGSVRSTRSGGDAAQMYIRMNDASTQYSFGTMSGNPASTYFGIGANSAVYGNLGYTSQNTVDQNDTYSGVQIAIPNKLPGGSPCFVALMAQEKNSAGSYITMSGGSNSALSAVNITKLEFFSQPDESFAFVQHSTISLYGLTRA
jgi:hypothetical protein